MSAVELRGFPLPIDYFIEEYDYIYRIQISFSTKDRTSGKDMKLFFLNYSFDKDNYSKAEALRAALIASLSHEVDECLYQDGDRIFDPHDPNKSRE